MAPQPESRIEAFASRMAASRCYTELQWFVKARCNPDLCGTTKARASLYRASILAQGFGFPEVAQWIEDFLADVD